MVSVATQIRSGLKISKKWFSCMVFDSGKSGLAVWYLTQEKVVWLYGI